MWRLWKQGIALSALAAAIVLWCFLRRWRESPVEAVAGRAGVVYFRHEGAMWQMDAAGTPSSRVPLTTAPDYGVPSYQRHETERWFVYSRVAGLPGEFPTFPNQRLAEDIRAGSEGGQDVLLLSEPDIEVISEPIWAADDASITFIGERWELDVDGVPTETLEAGLYELSIEFIDGVPVAGMLDFVADLSSQLRVDAGGFIGHEVAGHSWSPDRTAFTFGVRTFNSSPSLQEIWIVDLSLVSDPAVVPPTAMRLLASGHGIGWPEWSPDGSRIGYVSWDGTVIYDVSRDRSKTLRSTPNDSWGRVLWSPDGSYFVLCHWDNFYGYDAIYRFTAALTGKTELTAGLAPPDAPAFHNVLIPVGWRD